MELKNKIGATYQAPTTEVLDVIAEGVLCASGDHENWGSTEI
jgi:hypothetical protein